MMKKQLLMVAGPTMMEEEVRMAGAREMVYNRTPDFSAFIAGLQGKLQQVFRTTSDVYLISSSGTGAMEAAVVNVLSKGDDVLVLSGGTFGRRWHEIAKAYGACPRMLEVDQGESVDPKLLASHIRPQTKAVFVTANETSTGVLIDLEAIGREVQKTAAILVVDAVSSLGADRLEMDAWGLDLVITSSQKAFALPPGLSLLAVSSKAWACVDASDLPKYYFDLKAYRSNMSRSQTPFTPPISLLYQLEERLNLMLGKGLEAVLQSQSEKARYLRKGLEKLGLTIIGNHPSSGVTGILFAEDVNAFEVVQLMRNEYAIEITPSPGDDKARIARIGIFGDVSYDDIDRMLAALEKSVNSVRGER